MIKASDEAKILLVEDNPADQQLTLRAFNKGATKVKIYIVNDGQEAMDYLLNADKYSETDKYPLPDLILLDINMPRKDGKQVLQEIKTNQSLKMIPIIMLTTSDQEKDIKDAYNLGVNAYICKPARIADFLNVVGKVEEFWLNINQFPPKISKTYI